MKNLFILATLLCSTLMISAQTDYNEPPSRSEFEQVKSKIQLYERTQKNILSRLNAISGDISNSMKCVDSMLNCNQEYIDSMITAIMLENQGVQKNAITTFVKQDDLDPITKSIKDLKMEFKNELDNSTKVHYSIFIVLLVVILIITAALFGKVNKLKAKLNEYIEPELVPIKQEMSTMNETLSSKINTEILKESSIQKRSVSNLETDFNKKIDDINQNILSKVTKALDELKEFEAVQTTFAKATDDKLKSLNNKVDRNKSTLNKEIKQLKESKIEDKEQSEE